MISGHHEFFFLAIWWAGHFFPFFSYKLSITVVLHAIFFFRQALAGNFCSKSPTPPPPQELNGRHLRGRLFNSSRELNGRPLIAFHWPWWT